MKNRTFALYFNIIFMAKKKAPLENDFLEVENEKLTHAFTDAEYYFEKYKNIGVRIEDDMVVTETGTEWMTKKLPRKLEDVEAFMAKSQKEMQTAQFQRLINPTLTALKK